MALTALCRVIVVRCTDVAMLIREMQFSMRISSLLRTVLLGKGRAPMGDCVLGDLTLTPALSRPGGRGSVCLAPPAEANGEEKASQPLLGSSRR